jgi:SEFIR domain
MSIESLPPKVFISYSHDSQSHNDRVLALADRLREDGIDCNIDQYEQSPPEGWQRWMLNEVEAADLVLLVCSEPYDRRFRGREEAGKGKGAIWEGGVIIQELYDAQGLNSKFIPIVLTADDSRFIPSPLRSATHYRLITADDYDLLYRRLTNQHSTPKQDLGKLRKLDRRDRKQLFPDVLPTDSILTNLDATTLIKPTTGNKQEQSRKLEVDLSSRIIISKQKLKSRAWRGRYILMIFLALLLGVMITLFTMPSIFGLAGYFIFPSIFIGIIRIPFIFHLKRYLEDMYIYNNRPSNPKTPNVINNGRLIEDYCEDSYLIYKRTAACLYDFCEGKIVLSKAPPREIEKIGKTFVGICSEGGTDHSHFVDSIWVAIKKNFDWRDPERN